MKFLKNVPGTQEVLSVVVLPINIFKHIISSDPHDCTSGESRAKLTTLMLETDSERLSHWPSSHTEC